MAMAQDKVQISFGGGNTLIGTSWMPFFDSEICIKPGINVPVSKYFNQLSTLIENERNLGIQVFPSPENIFTWTWACSFNDIKVVILGQDPYPHELANGLAFSLPPEMLIPNPCSIRNIFTELKFEYPDFNAPNHGYLMGWARQGVLLLNTWLTVRAGEPQSHRDWETFTNAVILYLTNNKRNVVFILWGRKAKEKGQIITQGGNPNGHVILEGDHPSPVWAYNPAAKFFSHDTKTGQRIPQIPQYFVDCNNHLTLQAKIDWNYLPAI